MENRGIIRIVHLLASLSCLINAKCSKAAFWRLHNLRNYLERIVANSLNLYRKGVDRNFEKNG